MQVSAGINIYNMMLYHSASWMIHLLVGDSFQIIPILTELYFISLQNGILNQSEGRMCV